MTADSDRDPLITASTGASMLGIKSSTIRKWVERGHLQQRGTDERHRPLYRYSELLRVQRDRRYAKGGRPRKTPPAA